MLFNHQQTYWEDYFWKQDIHSFHGTYCQHCPTIGLFILESSPHKALDYNDALAYACVFMRA